MQSEKTSMSAPVHAVVTHRLSRVALNCNESSGLKPTVYCALVDVRTNEEVISADIEYVLRVIALRGYVVEGVTVEKRKAAPVYLRKGDEFDTVVSLDAYA